jgi:hypothetical protein
MELHERDTKSIPQGGRNKLYVNVDFPVSILRFPQE